MVARGLSRAPDHLGAKPHRLIVPDNQHLLSARAGRAIAAMNAQGAAQCLATLAHTHATAQPRIAFRSRAASFRMLP